MGTLINCLLIGYGVGLLVTFGGAVITLSLRDGQVTNQSLIEGLKIASVWPGILFSMIWNKIK